MILLNISTLLFLFLINAQPSVPNVYHPSELAFHWDPVFRLQPLSPFNYHHQVNAGDIPYYRQPFIPGTRYQQWDDKFPVEVKTVFNRVVGGVPAKKGDYPFIVISFKDINA